MNNLTFQELHEQLKSTPIALLTTAITKLETSQAKHRSLYRSQLFQDDMGTTQTSLSIGDGGDSELVMVLYKENQEIISILQRALDAIRTASDSNEAVSND